MTKTDEAINRLTIEIAARQKMLDTIAVEMVSMLEERRELQLRRDLPEALRPKIENEERRTSPWDLSEEHSRIQTWVMKRSKPFTIHTAAKGLKIHERTICSVLSRWAKQERFVRLIVDGFWQRRS